MGRLPLVSGPMELDQPLLSFEADRTGPRWILNYGLGRDRLSRAAQEIERAVFMSDIGYSAEVWHEEYDDWADRSTWLVLADAHVGQIVGCARCFTGFADQLKLDVDMRHLWGIGLGEALARHGVDPGTPLIESGTLAVLPEWRRINRYWPAKVLMTAMAAAGVSNRATHSVQLQDWPKLPRLMKMMVGVDPDRLADLEPVDFLGPVAPTIFSIEDLTTSPPPGLDLRAKALFYDGDETIQQGTQLPVIDLTAEESHLLSLSR